LEHHELLGMSAGLGFSTDYRMARGMTGPQEMAALTDEWTRLILSRRLADHPDIRQLSCDLVEMR
jgi:hypothetical protein